MFILNEHEDGHGHRHGNGHGHSKIQTLDTVGIAYPIHSKKSHVESAQFRSGQGSAEPNGV